MNKSHLLLWFIAFLSSISCKQNKVTSTTPWQLLPGRAAVVVHIPNSADFNAFLQNDLTPQVFDIFPAGKRLSYSFNSLKKLPDSESVLISFAQTGANIFDVLLIITPSNNGLNWHDGLSKWKLTDERLYTSHKIQVFSDGEQQWFTCVLDNRLLTATSSLLIEEALRKHELLKTPQETNELEQISNLQGQNALAHIYIKTEEIDVFWKHLFERQKLPKLKGNQNWITLDLQYEKNALVLAGLLHEDSEANKLVLSENDGDEFKAEQLIPFSAESWWVFNTSYRGSKQSNSETWDKSTPCGWFNYTQEGPIDYLKPVYFRSLGSQTPELWLDSLSANSDLQTQDYRETKIYSLENPEASKGFLPWNSALTFSHFAIVDKQLYASQSIDLLKSMINDFQNGLLLKNYLQKTKLDKQPGGKGQIHFGGKNPGLANLLMDAVNGKGMPALKTSEERLQPFLMGGGSLQKRGERLYLKFELTKGEIPTELVKTDWAYTLEGSILKGPFGVKTHSGKQMELMVQDVNFTLYHLDASGKLLWKKTLDGPLIGGIKEVDAFKNNKIQYVANTSASLYAFDRNGNPLPGYPISLPEAATAPVSVLDYDQNRNYRILIPMGTRMANYNIEGKPIQGWKAEKFPKEINQEAKYLFSGGKDFILVTSSDGTLRFLDRTGIKRLQKDLQITIKEGSVWWPSNQNNAKLDGFVGLNEKGDMVYLFTNGNLDVANTKADYLEISNQKGLRILNGDIEIELPKGVLKIEQLKAPFTHAKTLNVKQRVWVAGVVGSRNELWIFDENGAPLEGFPIYCEGQFAAGDFKQNGRVQLAVQGEGSTLVFYSFAVLP